MKWHVVLAALALAVGAACAGPSQLPLVQLPAAGVYAAGIAVSGRTQGLPTRRYTPSYRPDGWSGDLQAHAIDADGAQGALLWSAQTRVPPAALRNIWVGRGQADGRGAVPFDWPGLVGAGLDRLLGQQASAQLVDYLRGDRTAQAPAGPYRARSGALGDIVHSQPLVLGGQADFQYGFLPASTPGRDTYRSFLRDKSARAGLVFFGANDGMLHAVRESDGTETFAFVPAAALPQMATLAAPDYAHRFLVDGPLAESDAWWGGRWRNLLLGTTGAGAPAVFALDVTQSEALRGDSVLWEFGVRQDAELGSVLSPPETGLMRDGRWVALFGNGYGSASGRARLYIVDLQTGALVRTIDVHGGPGNGLGGVRVVRDSSRRIVAAYAGDLAGNLWRFDLSASTPSGWRVGFGGQPLFTARDGAGLGQAITATPEYLAHPLGGLMVLAGTGRLFEQGDLASAQPQSLYGLWDTTVPDAASDPARRIVSSASLLAQRLASVEVAQADGSNVVFDTVAAQPPEGPAQRGWRLALPVPFRDIYGPAFAKGFVRFKVIAPAALPASARALDLQLNPLTGGMASQPLFDTNADGVVNTLDLPIAGLRVPAEGRADIWVDSRGRGRIVDARGRPTVLDYGRQRFARSWRQIVNFPP